MAYTFKIRYEEAVKMRFKLKRFVSLTIGAVMMLGTVPPVSAESAGAVYVSHFEDFSGWTSEQGSNNDLPEGFCGFDGAYHPERAEATGTYVDEEVGTRAFKLGSGAIIAYGFDKVYKKGVRRISFDVKLSANLVAGKNFWLYGIENNVNDDVTDWKKGKDFDSRMYGCIKVGKFAAFNSSWAQIGITKDEPFYDFKWHKIELVFDYNNNKITYFVDGTYVAEDGNWSANKAFYFTNETGKDVYIDNFAVFHGENEEYAAENHMKVDGYGGGVIYPSGGKLQLDFSRALTDADGNVLTSVDKDDFKIKDSSGRDVSDRITEASLSDGRKSTVKLTLGALTSGVYTLEYKNASNSVTFRIARYVDGVECPDVEKVSYINHDGKEQNKNDGISTGTTAIDIQFTTPVKADNINENIKLTEETDGSDVPCTYTISSDGKTVSLTLERNLEPEAGYTLSVSENIAAAASADAKMGVPYSETFTTLNDAMYVISAEDIEKDGNNAYFKVKVIKTNNEPEHKYTYAAAGYENIVNPENGKTYMKMTVLNRFPVIISETDKGVISFGNNQPLDISNAEKINGFFWEYPNNLPIVIKEK